MTLVPRRLSVGLAVLGAAALIAGCGGGSDSTTTSPTAPGGDTAQYLEDVGAAVAALRTFSGLLQGTTSLEDLRARVPDARAELDSFDAAVAKLEGYSFDDATLEAQRAQLAATAPDVSAQLRRFLTAAQSGDVEAIQSVLPDVTQALTEFQAAATP